MAKKILKAHNSNRKKLKFYFPGRIKWNPFSKLDREAEKIPKQILLAIIFFLVSFFFLRKEKLNINRKILGLQTEITANQKLVFNWEQILLEKPDYRDGWLQLASAYQKIGNIEKAKETISKAKKLDPTNNTIIFLEVLLGVR